MAYPREPEHMEYLNYLEEYSMGEHEGPKMSKDEWKKKRKSKKTMDSMLEEPEEAMRKPNSH